MRAAIDVLQHWSTILGGDAKVGDEFDGRFLWEVTGCKGTVWYLKQLSPWRNLPIADEARVLIHLRKSGVTVPEYELTEEGSITAHHNGDTFVLMPGLANCVLSQMETLSSEEAVGEAIALLHQYLHSYPYSANSYTEDITGSLRGELWLPPSLCATFDTLRNELAADIAMLPIQLVHGDLGPGNILMRQAGTVSGFIDFDHLPLAPRIWDIAKYISRRLRTRSQSGDLPDGALKLLHIAGVVEGYHRTNPLQHAEVAGLAAAILVAQAVEVSYYRQVMSGALNRRMLPDHNLVTEDATDALAWQLEHTAEVLAVIANSVR